MSVLKKLFIATAAALVAQSATAQTSPPAAPAKVDTANAEKKDAPKPAVDAATNEAGLSEIVVTARRVGERLQDVPLSIRALGAAELEAKGINSITELSLFTPGLSYSPDFGRAGERPVIRGISALRTEAPQPVSVFINGVFVRDGALSMLLDDAARIEVIKGPQSALYGRSTYAGAINYITKGPGNELEGKVVGTVGSAGEQSLFAAVTLPISDMFSARIRAKSYEFGGQYTNSQTGNKIGNERTQSYGGEFLFKPSKRFDALASFDNAKDRDGIFNSTTRTVPTQVAGVITNQNNTTNIANGATCNGRTINIVGNNAQGIPDASVPATLANRLNGWPCGASNFTGTTVRANELDMANYTDPRTGINYGNIAGLKREITRGSATLNLNFDNGMVLTSQSAYTRQLSNIGADQSYNGTRFAITGTSWLTYDRDKLTYYSQELRLASSQDSALTWLVGAFYYRENTEGISTGVIAQSAGQVVPDFMRPKSNSSIRSGAPFGRIQFAFSDKLKVSAEGRYNSEEVNIGGTTSLGNAVATVGVCTAGQPCFLNASKTFKDFSPRITADYKIHKDMLFYAQYAEGSKSGGFNSNPGLPPNLLAFDGEKIKSVEVGMKSEYFNRKLRVNLAIFQNNVAGLQLSNISTVTSPFTGTASTTTIVNNVGKARTRGFETDISLRATKWLTLSGNYAYTDAKSIEGTETTNGTAFGGDRSVAGATLPRSPKQSAAFSAAVDTPTGMAGVSAFGRVDVVYQSRRYAEIQNLIWADPFTRINFNMGVRSADWRVTLFVKNAANDATSLNGFRYLDPVTFRRSAVDFLPRLRQYGVTVAYDF